MSNTGKTAVPALNRGQVQVKTLHKGDSVEFQGVDGPKVVKGFEGPRFPFQDPNTQDLTVWVHTEDGGRFPLADIEG